MPNYQPAQDARYSSSENEEQLTPTQLAFFERKLRQWRQELIGASLLVKNDLKDTCFGVPDLYDVASAQTEIHVELEGLKRNRLQITMIDKALARIKDGSYGYCELTGEKIGLKRLEIQPTATLCVEAQEMVERAERGSRYSQLAACRF
ncbi:MAG: TraR/DksA C4-type zinc finger protein [Pseudomonadota bacterium]